MKRFEWQATPTDHRFVLRGMVTSAAELTPMVATRPAPRAIVFDVAGVRSFTSSGVQGWLDFLHALQLAGCRPIFERCSPAIVKQTMSIHDFLCGGAVRSVVVPYVCPACEAEATDELVIGAAPPVLATARRCPCGADMELDDLPDVYRAFLAYASAEQAA